VWQSRFAPEAEASYRSVWQEYAGRHFAWLGGLYAVVLMAQLASGGTLLYVGIGGMLAVMGLGSALAAADMRNRIAQVVIDQGQFALWSVWDVLQHTPPDPFPLSYAAPSVQRQGLQLTYHDTVRTLDPDHWPHNHADLVRAFTSPEPIA
jgi:L-alanine-DL-glutamate epimerase-like enolase superfamily enzyme